VTSSTKVAKKQTASGSEPLAVLWTGSSVKNYNAFIFHQW